MLSSELVRSRGKRSRPTNDTGRKGESVKPWFRHQQ